MEGPHSESSSKHSNCGCYRHENAPLDSSIRADVRWRVDQYSCTEQQKAPAAAQRDDRAVPAREVEGTLFASGEQHHKDRAADEEY